MGRCDQGIKFCSIFKVLGMRRKQCHCICLVFLIPTVYLLSQTESVWRRYRDLSAKPNRQKFGMLTVPVRTVRTATWQGRTIMMMWQVEDVVHLYWLIVVQLDVDTCHIGSKWYEGTWPNAWVPRVPHGLVYIGYVKLMEATGFDP
jgi:hypothetical protein